MTRMVGQDEDLTGGRRVCGAAATNRPIGRSMRVEAAVTNSGLPPSPPPAGGLGANARRGASSAAYGDVVCR